MALKKNILREFFHHTDDSSTIPKNKIIDTNLINEKTSSNIKTHTHFKLFDNPLEENLATSLAQSENKLRTNLGQSSDKLRTNLGQSSDKLRTNLGREILKKTRNRNKPRTEPRTEPRTNLGQISEKVNDLTTFSSLIGLQREIVLLIYEQCKLSRNKATAPLSIEYLATYCKTTKLSAQKTIQRLEKKEVIMRIEYKNGRSGWTRYDLPVSIFQELLHAETYDKLRANLGQSSDKLRTEPRTEPRTNKSGSSSNIYINNTTTTEEPSELPPEWEAIDFAELHKRNVHFGKKHLVKFLPHLQTHTPFEFQESIDAFVYDIDHKHIQARKGLIHLFIGAIQGGTLYISAHYVSPHQQKLNELAALYEQREEKKFLAWLETHYDEIIKQLEKQSPSLKIDFEIRGEDSLLWIKKNLYAKKKTFPLSLVSSNP